MFTRVFDLIKKFLLFDYQTSRNNYICGFIIFLITLGFFIFYSLYPFNIKLFSDDAVSYINYDITRTVGYPLFLSFVKYLTGGYEAVPYFQLTIFSISIGWLAYKLVNHFSSLILGAAFPVIIFSLIDLIKYNYQIFTESLFISGLVLLAERVLSFTKKETKFNAAGISLITGILILIRPSAFALIPSLFILVINYWKTGWKLLANFFYPLIGCILFGCIFNYYLHGIFSTQSFLGHNLYGKVAFVLKPGMHSEDPLEQQMIDKMVNVMVPVQKVIETVSSYKFKYIISLPIYDKLRFQLLFNEFTPALPKIALLKDRDNFYKNIANKVIQQNPVDYIKDVFLNLGALWFIWDINDPHETTNLKKVMKKIKDTEPFKNIKVDYNLYKFRCFSKWIVISIRTYLSITLILSIGFIIFFLLRFLKNESINSVCILGVFCSINTHVIYFLTALLQAGWPRYSMVMWPYLFIITLTVAAMIFNQIRKKAIP